MEQTAEKTQEKDGGAPVSAAPEPASAAEPDEIKACVGATGGEDGAGPEPEAGSEPGSYKEPGSSIPPEELERLRADLVAALKTVFDPEIPVDIYELGLIYRLEVDDDRNIDIDMTLTAPGCPVAGDMPGWVENAVAAVPGVGQVKVNLTFDPPWDMSRMSDEAKLELNMF
jgi:FeS assembly SUF system protein